MQVDVMEIDEYIHNVQVGCSDQIWLKNLKKKSNLSSGQNKVCNNKINKTFANHQHYI